MSFMDVLGKIINPKNVLTAMGALSPLGPAAGGAAGRALGGVIDPEDEGNPLFDAASGAALGAGGSFAAGALGGGAPAPAPAEGFMGSAAVPASTAPVAQSVGGAGGGFGSGIKGWWNALSGSEKATMLGQGIGAVGNVYGAYESGRVMDEENERRRRMDRALTPLLRDTLSDMRR